MESVESRSRGGQIVKVKLIKSKSTLKNHNLSRLVPGRSLKKCATLVPQLSKIDNYGPLKIFLKKKTKEPSENHGIDKISPWLSLWKITISVPTFSDFTLITLNLY